MTVPSNPIQFTTFHGARPFVVCFGPDGGPFTLASTATPLPVSAGVGTPSVPADALATPSAIPVASYPSVYNGVGWDLMRGVEEGTALPSASRTATTSFNLTNRGARGIILFLNVTVAPAAPGTGGLQPLIIAVDPVSGAGSQLLPAPAKVTTAIVNAYIYYPSNLPASGLTNVFVSNTVIPRRFLVAVTHNDAQPYTYGVGYSFLQ